MPLPGTTLFTDDFNRADGGLGSNWAGGYTAINDLAIVSNRVRGSTDGGNGNLQSIVTSLPNDQWGLLQFATMVSAGVSIRSAQIWLRMPAPSTVSGYSFLVVSDPPLAFNSAIFDEGTATELASENVVLWDSGDWLLATAQGTTLTLYRLASGGDPDVDSFTQILQTTNGAYSSGRGGVKIYVGAGTPLSEVEVDNMRFGQFGSGAAVTQIFNRMIG